VDFIKRLFQKAPDMGAIDIGSSFVKFAVVEKKKSGQPDLLYFAVAPTPPMTIKDGSILDAQTLGDTIAGLLRSNSINAQKFKLVSAVAGQQVVIRPIPMTKMKPEEVRQAIRFEAERYLPYPVADATVSGTILSDDVGDGRQMEVLLVAVPNEIVEAAREVIKMAEVEPAGITLEPLALQKSLQFCLSEAQLNGTVVLVNVGASFSSINIFSAQRLKHNRTISIAGNSFTKAIGQSLNVSFDEAEKIKKEKGVIKVDGGGEDVAPTTQKIFNLVEPVLKDFVTEVQRSIDYYRSRNKDEGIDLVVLSGGTAAFKNIEAYLSKEFGVDCIVANPFANLNLSKVKGMTSSELRESAPASMVVLGLALQ
jgi:type IV pilus assembly protein PilM